MAWIDFRRFTPALPVVGAIGFAHSKSKAWSAISNPQMDVQYCASFSNPHDINLQIVCAQSIHRQNRYPTSAHLTHEKHALACSTIPFRSQDIDQWRALLLRAHCTCPPRKSVDLHRVVSSLHHLIPICLAGLLLEFTHSADFTC